jgi:cysteinyl-tRNA synthetase
VFEIHGGGLDLVFPHHENEVAQSRALGHPFAQIWAHNGMLRFTGEKMSKSVGNVATIRETLDEWGREAVLVFFLTASWRKPIDFSPETMAQAKAQWTTFVNSMLVSKRSDDGPTWAEFASVLDDDFNTPEALALMHEWRRAGNQSNLGRALSLFGLTSRAPGEAPMELRLKAEHREQARRERDFTLADELRGEIEAAGWEVRDIAESPGYQLVPKP